MKSVYRDTSNSAFWFYYVGPMSYGEGKKEMVQRFGLFTEEVYNNLYEKLGGHVSFFKYVWRKHNDNMQYDDAINFILEQSQIIVSACLMHIQKKEDQEEVMSLFQQLHQQNFSLQVVWLTDVTKHLISCNLLFYNALHRKIAVQNYLLEKVIGEMISTQRANIYVTGSAKTRHVRIMLKLQK